MSWNLFGTWEGLILAGLAVAAAYVVRGALGFASNLVAVALLVLWQPLAVVVPVIILADLAGSIILGAYDFREIRWPELAYLAPALLVGIGLGARLLSAVPTAHLVPWLGLLVVVYTVWAAFVHTDRLPSPPSWMGAPLGLLAGFLGSLYGTGGSPIVAYFHLRRLEKRAFRATFQFIGLIFSSVTSSLYVHLGLIKLASALTALSLVPAVAVGLWLGNRLHFRLDLRSFEYATLALLGVLGLKMMWPW